MVNLENKHIYRAVGVICCLVLLFMGVKIYQASVSLPSELSEWQAVFLEGGQVYFGHLEDHNQKFYKLANVYYLKYGTSLQQDVPNSDSAAPEQKLNLIKLGGELHGPENLMYIVKDKVMFVENLKASSPVVQAIKKTN
jgi:hypothetical protein